MIFQQWATKLKNSIRNRISEIQQSESSNKKPESGIQYLFDLHYYLAENDEIKFKKNMPGKNHRL